MTDRPHADGGFECGAAPSQFLVEHLGLLRPGRTLDVACGRGRNARLLAEAGHRLVGVDLSLEALRFFAASVPGAVAIRMDLDRPGLREAVFDNVVCVNFLDRRLFPEFRRWLRPGGRLLIDTFGIEQPRFGHPHHRAFLLDRGELLRLLGGWKILAFREGPTLEHDVPCDRASAVAERPG
jgi:tellurite methyltransferase